MTENEIKEKVLELTAQIHEGEDVILVCPQENLVRDYYYNPNANDETGEIDEDVLYGLRDFIEKCEGLTDEEEIREMFQDGCKNWGYYFCESNENDELYYTEDGLEELQKFVCNIEKAKNNEDGYLYIDGNSETGFYRKIIDFAKECIEQYDKQNKETPKNYKQYEV